MKGGNDIVTSLIEEIKISDDSYFFISYYSFIEHRKEKTKEKVTIERRKKVTIERGNILKNLSKINIFVGENNSGKSRLLRSFVKTKELEFIDNYYFTSINKIISYLLSHVSKVSTQLRGTALEGDLDKYLNEIKPLKILTNKEDLAPINNLLNYAKSLKNQNVRSGHIRHSDIGIALEKIIYGSFDKFDIPLDEFDSIYKFKKIYIPILRGLRPLGGGNPYLDRTNEDYFSSGDGGIGRLIFTGLEACEKVKSLLLGRLEERNLINEYQNFLSENFFDNKEVTLIPDLNKARILRIKIGDEKEKEIYDLGDGIQAIIIMTLPLFIYKEEFKDYNTLIFIEEPEIFLHPGLQRNLIDIFLDKKFGNVQFFFTTHSNHFLDITFDFENISIFTLKKELAESEEIEKDPKFLIENVSEGDKSALELLGVKNSSVFLSNCTIWVEGITDRYYIKRYFDKFQEYKKDNEENFVEFREDYHYSFVEYGGNNITHWSFLDDEEELDEEDRINVDKLCSTLFLIADNDNAKGKKAERLKKLKANLGDRFYPLESKEIENTLSKDVLLEVIKDYECGEDGRDEVNYEFEESYKSEPLGKFIECTILEGNFTRKGGYKSKTGNTIKGKVEFCKKALNHIKSYENLSEEARKMCELLYQFIATQNGNISPDLKTSIDVVEDAIENKKVTG